LVDLVQGRVAGGLGRSSLDRLTGIAALLVARLIAKEQEATEDAEATEDLGSLEPGRLAVWRGIYFPLGYFCI
jgi:hypothetical protein